MTTNSNEHDCIFTIFDDDCTLCVFVCMYVVCACLSKHPHHTNVALFVLYTDQNMNRLICTIWPLSLLSYWLCYWLFHFINYKLGIRYQYQQQKDGILLLYIIRTTNNKELYGVNDGLKIEFLICGIPNAPNWE